MADPLQTNVQVNDIPEYLRDYRAALLNAAFGSVFTEPYLRQQFPKGQFAALTQQAPQATTSAPSGGATPPENTRTETTPEEQGIAAALRSSRSRLPNLLGMVYDPKTRTYIPEAYQFITSTRMAGGGSVNDDEIEKILKSYQDLRKDMPVGLMQNLYDAQGKETLTGAVTAPGRKNPFGELIGPSQTSLYTTGSSFGSSLDRFNQAPDITPAPTTPVSTGVKTPPPPERLSPPSPAAPPSTRPPSTRPPGASAPSTPSIPGAPGSSAPAIPGLVGLTQDIAPIYSPGLAGTTQTPAGYNPAQYATDAQAQGIAKLLGGSTASTNVGGPNAPPSQNLINLGGSDVFNAGLVQQRLRAGQTPSEMTMSLQMMRDEVARSGGNTAEIDRMIEQNNRAYAAGAKTSPVGMAGGGSLAQFDIGDDGKVKNYRKGGAIRKQVGGFAGPNIGGFGASTPPAMGGFQNLFTTANPNVSGIPQIFNPPPVYGGQRVMQFGTTDNPLEFGQYAPGVGFKASDMTLDALRGARNLPSIFDSQGRISAGTDFGKGVGSINFATDIAGEAAATGRDFLGQTMSSPEQQSYLMSLMPGIKEMGFKGPIKVDPLKAPTLQAPTGVTAAGLKDYQMEQPLGVSGENIDILGRLGGVDAAQIEGVPQVQQFQMSPAERVAAERTAVDAFGRPQAQQYMSPYMESVVEAQKREASRQAAMQKAGRSAAAVRAGAFGGSRQAIQEGMAEEALQRQIGDIEAVGRQRAFENAQAQFERDRAASLASQQANVQSGLQAALANQQAGVTTGRENLGALLATQQLGTQAGLQAALANQQARQQAGLTQYGTTADILRGQSAQNLQAALANQQAGLTAGRENLAARLGTQQLAAQQALQAQLANQQAGLTAGQGNLQSALATQQLATQAGLEAAKASQSGDLATWQMQLDAIKQASGEQEAARQRNFQNRLAAMQQAQAGAAGLAGLGGTMMGIPGMAQQIELQRLAAMQQAGGAIDARTQQALDLAYQDFINQQNFPYQQMNFLQGILGGVPTGMQVEGVQFQRPAAGGLTGLIGAGAGSLLNYLNK